MIPVMLPASKPVFMKVSFFEASLVVGAPEDGHVGLLQIQECPLSHYWSP